MLGIDCSPKRKHKEEVYLGYSPEPEPEVVGLGGVVTMPAQEIVDTFTGVLAVVAAYEGYISDKELEWDGEHDAFPAYPTLGTDGQVHIWGTSGMPISKIMRCRWTIRNPSGVVEQNYERKTMFGVGAYGTEEFVGPKFGLDMVGDWTISVTLFLED